jgi:hypothetical protein
VTRSRNHRCRTALLLAGIVSSGLAVAPGIANSAKSKAKSCAVAHSHTIHVDRAVRVFTKGEFLAGCSRRDGRIKTLAHDGFLEDGMGSENYAHVRVAGTWVAHEDYATFNPVVSSVVVVQDLRRAGKRIASGTIAYYAGFRLSAPERLVHLATNARVTDLELRDNGTVAWIQRDPAGTQLTVRVLGKHATTDLDSGPAIDPASLRLKGRTLTWTVASAVRSATIA